MPSPDPDPPQESPQHRPGLLRANLLPAAGVGVLMGVLAEQEGSGIAVAVVVAVTGCGVVLGLLALKKIFYGG